MQASLREVISALNRNLKGIVLLLDDERKLLGSLTDGDVRRAFLAGAGLEDSALSLVEQKKDSHFSKPITARLDESKANLLMMMKKHSIRQVPLLDDQGRVADLVIMADLVPYGDCSLQAVVMAGGKGTRLMPMTSNTPKPMLPLGDRPLLELILDQLKHAGINQVKIATHYLAERIQEHFGDGSGFGLELDYINEKQPLGTAGALGLIQYSQDPLLVINGDVLTKVNFRAMLEFHRETQAKLTVGVRKYDLGVPYGVVECDGAIVTSLKEKPVQSFFVNAGIYLIEPKALALVPNNQAFDMTDLVQLLLKENLCVSSFPIHEYWLDIGQRDDYARAQEDIKNGRFQH